ncbi:MAG: hypothetical protein ACKOBG_11135 [Actinomycetota bacterium]
MTQDSTRSWPVLERIAPDDLNRAAAAAAPGELQEVARVLGLPGSVLTSAEGAADALLRRVRKRPAIVPVVAVGITSGVRNEAIDALGDASEDPTFEELTGVLDDLVAAHGAPLVALMLAGIADGGFRAAEVCGRVLDEDPRFAPEALGPVRAPAERTRGPVVAAPAPVDEAKREERRQRKQAAKQQRRATGAPPPRPKRTARPTPGPSATAAAAPSDPAPVPTVNGRPAATDPAPRRLVRVSTPLDGVDYTDPLVGAVVTTTIRWQNEHGEEGEKIRPGVVIATCAGDRVVVRPCYSEGGLRSRDWRSVPITDALAAGLDRDSYVGSEEHVVDRVDVSTPIGRLARVDWNAL